VARRGPDPVSLSLGIAPSFSLGAFLLFTFRVTVFERSECDLDFDGGDMEWIEPPFVFIAHVTVRALSRKDAVAVAYYQALGRQRAAFLRRLRAPEFLLRNENDLLRIRREVVRSDAASVEHGMVFDYVLDRSNVQTFYFAVRPVTARSPRTAHCRNRIGVKRACLLTGRLLREPLSSRRN